MEHDARTIRIVRVIGGTRRDIEIPADRARELGIGTSKGTRPTVSYLMDGLVAWGDAGPSEHRQCPQCGTSHRELILRHTAGCSRCYEVYSGTIDRLLALRRSRPVHVGRIPRRLQRYRQLFVEREDLLSRLNIAVEAEDFEAAADLRDRIRSMSDDGARRD